MLVQWFRDTVASRAHMYNHHRTPADDEKIRRQKELEEQQKELEQRVRVAEALRDAMIIARNR